jgi:HAD superfamily hydrolase (TIGR01509 family)
VQRPSAVIFDLDGVLLESEQVWSAAKRELTLARGGVWSEAAEREMLGMSSTEWSRYMRGQLRVPMAPSEISAAVVELVASRYREELPLIDGANAAVHTLGARFPLGLASSSNRQIIDLVLELTGWSALFSVTVSSEEVAHGKPAPDVYLETVRRLEVTAGPCAAIEDSGAGISSALGAGLPVVAIPNRAYPPDPEILRKADVVLDSLSQLEVAIAGLATG